MLPLTFSKISNLITSLIIKCTYCTRPAPKYIDMNQVNLIGTAISNSFTHSSGKKTIYIETQMTESGYVKHQIDFNMKKNFTIGDRIILNGHMKGFRFEDNAGKQKTRISVAAHRMFKIENSQENESSSSDDEKDFDDVNQVQFSGNLATDARETENFTFFRIATHYYQVYGSARMTSFHLVQIFDEELRAFVKDNIGLRDSVIIKGQMANKMHTTPEGRQPRQPGGYIIAEKLWKFNRNRANLQNKQTEREEDI